MKTNELCEAMYVLDKHYVCMKRVTM